MLLLSRAKRSGGRGAFLESKNDRFHCLVSKCPQPRKAEGWKYKMDPFWGRGIGVFLTVGEKIAPGRNVFQNSVLSFLNIGNYGLC